MNTKLLAPGKHSRTAIYGGAVALFTALAGAAKDGSVSFAEACGMVGATAVGYLAVWAGVNEPRTTTDTEQRGSG